MLREMPGQLVSRLSCARVLPLMLVVLTSAISVRAQTVQPITPFLDEIVVEPVSGRATIYFGYSNPNTKSVTVNISDDDNFFIPSPPNRGQITRFLPGVHHYAFASIFDYNVQPSITWVLNGAQVTANPAAAQVPPPTAFTYQGRLTDAGSPATGKYDLRFALYDVETGGTQQGATQTVEDVQVAGGVFTVRLDFGANVFASGAARFLEIAVRAGDSAGDFTRLDPRQPITVSPYAVRTISAQTADTAGDARRLGGVEAAEYVQTSDPRLTDARPPAPGGAGYVQNQTAAAQPGGFNVAGPGTLGGALTVGGPLTVGGAIGGNGSGLTSVVRVVAVNVSAGTTFNPNPGQYVFAQGTPSTVTTTANQRVTGALTGALILPPFNSGFSDARVGLCYRSTAAGSPVVPFAKVGANDSTPTYSVDTVIRPYTANASVVPGAGTWQVGLCLSNEGDRSIFVAHVDGWLMITND